MIRKTTQGFTIIELLIAFAIGSLLAGILFQTFFQSNRFVQVLDDVIATNTSAMTVLNQMEKDITGIYAPIVFPEKSSGKKEGEKKDEAPKTDTKKDGKEQTPKDKKPDDTEKKPKKKPLTKVFYATEHNELLGILSFITTNSLSTYVNTATGRMRPKFVRVLYKLEQEPDPDGNKSTATYRLLRKESAELDFERSQKDATTFWYELATGVQELNAEYITVQENKEGQLSEESVTSWDIKENQKKESEKKPEKKKVLGFVTFTLSFANKHDTTVFESTFAIASQPYIIQKKQTPEKTAAEKTDKKKEKEGADTKKSNEKTDVAATKTKTKKESSAESKVSANTAATAKQSEKK